MKKFKYNFLEILTPLCPSTLDVRSPTYDYLCLSPRRMNKGPFINDIMTKRGENHKNREIIYTEDLLLLRNLIIKNNVHSKVVRNREGVEKKSQCYLWITSVGWMRTYVALYIFPCYNIPTYRGYFFLQVAAILA